MRAAVVAGPGSAALSLLPLPAPGPGQIRIRLEGCGICGSNLPTWEGRPWFRYPLPPGAPGHEGWGTIDAVGTGVRGLAEGDRVSCLGAASFAEFEVVDAAHVVKLPRDLDGAPFPGEPLACAVNVFRRSAIERGHTVAVVGIGFLGAVVVQLAARAGARVIAIGRRRFALDVALEMGASGVVALGDPAGTRLRVASLAREVDVAVEATGAQLPLDLAGSLVRVRGRLVIAGYHQDGRREIDMQSWNWRGLDVVNAHERDPQAYLAGMRLAVEAVAGGRLDTTPLLTHRFPLEKIADAFEAVRTRPDGFMKALVVT
jgi:threonine dehydrogenase-like Zn-dependent dehydrogenase